MTNTVISYSCRTWLLGTFVRSLTMRLHWSTSQWGAQPRQTNGPWAPQWGAQPTHRQTAIPDHHSEGTAYRQTGPYHHREGHRPFTDRQPLATTVRGTASLPPDSSWPDRPGSVFLLYLLFGPDKLLTTSCGPLYNLIPQHFLFNLLVNFTPSLGNRGILASWNPGCTQWVDLILTSWFAMRKRRRELSLPQGHFDAEIALGLKVSLHFLCGGKPPLGGQSLAANNTKPRVFKTLQNDFLSP